MANVDIRQGYKDLAWFNANPTLVLKQGQRVNYLQTGTYKLGDGTTQLSSLLFLGGGGSGSPAGSDTQLQYNNSGSFGASSAMTYASSGLNLGNAIRTNQRLVRIGQGTAVVDIGNYPALTSAAAMYMNELDPTTNPNNYTLLCNNDGEVFLNGWGGTLRLRVGNVNKIFADGTRTTFLNTENYFNNTFAIVNGTEAAGRVLTCDANGVGTWQTPSAGGSPAGSNQQVQFNNSGSFGASAGLYFNDTIKEFGVYNAAGFATFYTIGQSGSFSIQTNVDSTFTGGSGSTLIFRPNLAETFRANSTGLVLATGKNLSAPANVNFSGLPTSASGLSAGDLWNNSGVVNIV